MVNGVLILDISSQPERRFWLPVISVVVPAFNETAGLQRFHQRLAAALADQESWNVVYVDDGSTDGMLAVMQALQAADSRVGVGGMQLMFLGIISEYLGRVFNENKQRPLYLVERYVPSAVRAIP
jgi:cellulose synthase/poly-beta-1,6-N-acetylglucosamine synthase-like glycosyltransferase